MKSVLILIAVGILVSACDTKSTVTFKDGRFLSNEGDGGTPVNGLAWTHGGITNGTATGGSKVTFTLGDSVNQVQTVTTPGGYTVDMNIQGQLVY